NHVTIEGDTALAFSEDVGERFEAYHWHVQRADPYDHESIATALSAAIAETARPSLIITRSHIGYGAPHKQDTREAHGEPLGPEEVKATKKFYGWPEDAQFLVPDGVYQQFQNGIGKRGAAARSAWQKLFDEYRAKFPELVAQL